MILTQADEFSLTVEAEDNIVPEITTRNENDVLVISFADQRWTKSYIPTEPIPFLYQYARFKRAVYYRCCQSGNGKTLQTADLTLKTDGAADIRISDLQVNSLLVDLNGGAQFDLSGKANQQEIQIDGAGSYDGADLETGRTIISISGAAEVMLWATEDLDIDIDGAGSVRYYGNPHVTQDIDGISSVRGLGER